MFEPLRVGPWLERPNAERLLILAARMDEVGLCPTLDDGFAAGNVSALFDGELWVSASGRMPGAPASLVHVTDFDPDAWTVKYRSPADAFRPTSDTPLHHFALKEAADDLGWTDPPQVALHGHALATREEAERLGLPCSDEETRFSTREDREALRGLLGRYAWPEHSIWIRQGHGFVLLARDLAAAEVALEALIEKLDG